MQNLNLLFNKTYYESLTVSSFPDVQKMNKLLLDSTFSETRDYIQPAPMVNHSFVLTVCYPGLLIGIGYTHDAGMGNDEIGIGFSFDYVTGQPYIPGSTVKGVLRRHFKDHPQVIAELCGKDLEWVQQLETQIFDYSDIFFDAVVYRGNHQGKLLGLDYITPHKAPTENPVPIKFLKILPDVRFSFRFRLTDSEHMKKEEKAALFQKLLCLFGIGAKTNVGFGILTEKAPAPRATTPPPRNISQPAMPRKESQNKYPQGKSKTINMIICPHCGTKNHRYKPDSTEQWPSWPKCRNRNCGKDLL